MDLYCLEDLGPLRSCSVIIGLGVDGLRFYCCICVFAFLQFLLYLREKYITIYPGGIGNF